MRIGHGSTRSWLRRHSLARRARSRSSPRFLRHWSLLLVVDWWFVNLPYPAFDQCQDFIAPRCCVRARQPPFAASRRMPNLAYRRSRLRLGICVDTKFVCVEGPHLVSCYHAAVREREPKTVPQVAQRPSDTQIWRTITRYETSTTFITSSPRWLIAFTAILPEPGFLNGREVSEWRLCHASSSTSAFSVVLRAL